MEELKKAIRDVPDFPKPGIVFKDITPLLADGKLYAKTVNALRDRYIGKKIDVVAGIEARGFIFASGLAYALGAGLVIIRKPRKLPYKTFSQTYSLEYGTDTIEIHQDAVKPGQNVLVIDDVLATGGTVSAAAELLKKNFRGNIVEVAFIIELDFLKGREKLQGLPIHSLIHF
ncbi:MAG: adenine phosphoribosyltransferase [Nitrospinae bacterium]|nr:adenine phosphoribosyltransferase [Nitrospinota bacterium]